MMSFRQIFLFVFLVFAFPVSSFATAAEPEFAQTAQVWEPGDPVPDAGLDMGVPAMTHEASETETPLAPLPKKRPGQRSAVSPAATAEPQGDSEDETESTGPATASGTASDTGASGASDPADFLCARAPEGKTAPVPEPFDGWFVRVCSPKGQALVPVKGEAWVAHGSADPVSILAMPPGAVPPPADASFDARYDIRFDLFAGGETADDRLARAKALIKAATGEGEKTPAHDEVWQLDAVSNLKGAHYNIFFYVAGKSAEGARPHHLIACLDQCRQALYLDVLTGAEAAEVLGQ